MHHLMSATRRVALTAALAALTLGVAGCGSESAGPGSSAATGAASAPLVIEDGWVKSVDEMPMASPSMSGPMPSESSSGMDDMEQDDMDMSMPMSAVFGTLRNTTDAELTITGGSSPAAGEVQLHEVVKTSSGAMQMQQKPGGFVLPAGGTHLLQPGGDHVMLLGLTGALPTGSETTITLTTSAGEVTLTLPVRAFTGAEESYDPSPTNS